MTRSFHIALHARPASNIAENEVSLEGRTFKQLHLSAQSFTEPLRISFEAAVEQLSALPRMLVEPDGSFVWVSDSIDDAWQLDGVLFDRGGRMQYVELRGSCTEEAFESLAGIMRAGHSRLVIQLLRQAIFLREEEFRRLMW